MKFDSKKWDSPEITIDDIFLYMKEPYPTAKKLYVWSTTDGKPDLSRQNYISKLLHILFKALKIEILFCAKILSRDVKMNSNLMECISIISMEKNRKHLPFVQCRRLV